MDPVSVTILIRRTARRWIGDQAERQTTLSIVVDGPETDLVVAFVDWAVVNEFRGVQQVETVHATPA